MTRALDVVLTSTKTDDQIYYTFDASLPKDSWTLYTGPIHLALPSNTTISAYGINNRVLSGSSIFTYDIGDYDLVNPTVIVILARAGLRINNCLIYHF